jgi:hypothetical protein
MLVQNETQSWNKNVSMEIASIIFLKKLRG